MTLASPGFLALLVAGGAVAWAYLRRAPPRRARTSSLLLLRRAAALPNRKRRVEDLWSLVLLLLALLAAVGAASLSAAPPRPLVVVLDHSASMGGRTLAGDTALQAARSELDRLLEEHPDAPVTLVTTPPLAVPVQARRDAPAVREAAARVVPGGRFADPSALVADACAHQDDARVVVLSNSWAAPEDLGCDALQPGLVQPAGNQGIVALAGRVVDALGLVELHVQSSETEALDLAVSVDGAAPQAVTVEGEQVFWLSLPQGGTVQLSAPDDGNLLDNRARVEVPGSAEVRATVVTDAPDGYAALALGAHPRVSLQVVGPEDPVPESDLVVMEVAHRAGIPAARRVLLLGVSLSEVGLPPAGTVRRPVLTGGPPDPALRWSRLDDLFVERTAVLPLPEGASALLTTEAGAVAVRLAQEGGEVVAFGFGLRDSDLGLRAAWVNLVANLVDEAAPLPAILPAEGLLDAAESAPPVVVERPVPAVPLAAVSWGLLGVAGVALLAEALAAAARRRQRA